jgi:hypothetical protein
MGISMLLTLAKSKQMFLLALVLLSLQACKQSEFYDKAALLDPSKAAGSNPGTDTGTVTPPTDTTTDNGGSSGGSTGGGTTGGGDTGSGGTGGTGGGTTTNPPVVVTPPVIVDPPVVVNPPVIVDPPVVVTPPVVVEPPVVVTPPVVVDPPVVVTPKVDCVGAWSACSVTCGGGVQTFAISTAASGGGNMCVASAGAIQACNPQACVNLVDRSEVFTQDSTRDGDVDILWVIDDSGSMADNQDALARNFGTFINQFLAKNIDFKMAITTTDGTSTRNGKMVGDSSKLTRASAQGNRTAFTNNFTKWIKVGTSGSGIEQGLKCASSFLDRYASSFLRDDAYLAIVFVSDEEDQSEKKKEEYLARFQAAKRSPGMVKAYSIVTTKLPKNAQWETIGTRYEYVSDKTSGKYSDITDDFAATLSDMGGSIVNLIDKFPLAEAPYNDLIKVYVNNVQVTAGWTYDSVAHTLKFNANAVPAEGAKIEVRYQVKATVLGAI